MTQRIRQTITVFGRPWSSASYINATSGIDEGHETVSSQTSLTRLRYEKSLFASCTVPLSLHDKIQVEADPGHDHSMHCILGRQPSVQFEAVPFAPPSEPSQSVVGRQDPRAELALRLLLEFATRMIPRPSADEGRWKTQAAGGDKPTTLHLDGAACEADAGAGDVTTAARTTERAFLWRQRREQCFPASRMTCTERTCVLETSSMASADPTESATPPLLGASHGRRATNMR